MGPAHLVGWEVKGAGRPEAYNFVAEGRVGGEGGGLAGIRI
jgi:hypothetical protein